MLTTKEAFKNTLNHTWKGVTTNKPSMIAEGLFNLLFAATGAALLIILWIPIQLLETKVDKDRSALEAKIEAKNQLEADQWLADKAR